MKVHRLSNKEKFIAQQNAVSKCETLKNEWWYSRAYIERYKVTGYW